MPALVESDGSDVDTPDEIPAKAKAAQSEESEESEGDEDEYVVEKIISHKFEGGVTKYLIKWAGYEDEADRTWEPIENLSGAQDLLEAYHRNIGGTPEPPVKGKKAGKGNRGKRAASSAFADSPAPASSKKGRGRKSEANGEAWEPPLGSWEDQVKGVTAIIEADDVDAEGTISKKKGAQSLEGLLEWHNGKKTQHKMPVLRQRCPQKLLDYYEGHLLFVD